jgi:hypothetical protein
MKKRAKTTTKAAKRAPKDLTRRRTPSGGAPVLTIWRICDTRCSSRSRKTSGPDAADRALRTGRTRHGGRISITRILTP